MNAAIRRLKCAAKWTVVPIAYLALAGCNSDSGAGSGATPGAGPDAAIGGGEAAAKGLLEVEHVVVIVLENWSFDSLYGEFEGADGLSSPNASIPQIDPATGAAYVTLPQEEPYLPATLPNAPFALDPYFGLNGKTTMDLTQKFYQEQMQIDDGKMDKFVAFDAAKGLTMGFFHTVGLPLAAEAKKYLLCDHFFHSAFGGSFLNHVWLIAAATPNFPDAPDSMKAILDPDGHLAPGTDGGPPRDGPLTPDGYVVNTLYSVNSPHPNGAAPASLVPDQAMPTIGDRLSEKGVGWAWYAGGWNDALAGRTDAGTLYQYHHQPFVYFANYADGTEARTLHLKDEDDFISAAKEGTLPAVSFVKPVGIDNEHPNYTDVLTGEAHVLDLINAVRNGPNWKDSVIIVTYDENGGFWDHVAPPKADRWGPGTRVPTLVISPFARKGFVDHTTYETVSVLALIEKRWGLAALGARDAAAAALTNAFEFGGSQ